MSETTPIEWCDATLNLWWGCTKVSDGCKFCYAEHLADTRYNKGNWGPKGERREVKSWRSVLAKVSKRAKAENRRLRVFCSSMSDVFEGPETMGGVDSENWATVTRLQSDLFYETIMHPELDFLFLTKRPENVLARIPWTWPVVDLPSNIWIGTSIEDQKTADERIPHLLKIPAAVRFLSCEPMLGPVDLRDSLDTLRDNPCNCGDGECSTCWQTPAAPIVNWVICGGESGPNARPMHPDWARSLRDQCNAADVPFLFKQWGEWGPSAVNIAGYTPVFRELSSHGHWVNKAHWIHANDIVLDATGKRLTTGKDFAEATYPATIMRRVGKKAAGRVLDGKTWEEFPVR